MCSLQQIQATDCQEAVQKRQDTAAEATDTHSAGPEVVRHGGLCLLLPGALSPTTLASLLLQISYSEAEGNHVHFYAAGGWLPRHLETPAGLTLEPV